MKILHVVPSYLPAVRYGGPIWSVHGLCSSLVKLGHEVEVYTTSVDGAKDSKVPLLEPVLIDGVTVTYFPVKALRRIYWAPTMETYLKQTVSEFQLLHIHSLYLWPTWVASRIARKIGIPYVTAPRGMLTKDAVKSKNRIVKSIWLALIEKENIERASAIHVTSKLEAERIKDFGYRLPPTKIIPNGVDPLILENIQSTRSEYNPQFVETVTSAYLLFIGRISWEKGLDRLVQAMKHIPDAKLVLVGNDETEYAVELKQIIRNFGLEERVSFYGPAYGKEKYRLIQNASAIVMASYFENFGNAVLEAMAMGRPVVVTPEVGLASFVEESSGGFVVEGEPEKLCIPLRNLLSDENLGNETGKRGQLAVNENYRWEAIAKKTVHFYEGILAQDSIFTGEE